MADTNIKRADSSVDQLNIWEYAKQKMEQESKTQDISRTFVILGDKGVGKTSVIENIGAISKSSKDMT
jgi:GTPase SAR1 family protein